MWTTEKAEKILTLAANLIALRFKRMLKKYHLNCYQRQIVRGYTFRYTDRPFYLFVCFALDFTHSRSSFSCVSRYRGTR